MQSRRDQVQAHNFMLSRLTTSMLAADPDALETPMGRTKRGSVIGLVLGALLCAGFLVFGLLVPGGSDAWRTPGALVVEKETGARFVYAGGVLRPVLNYTSARLALGEQMTIAEVSRESLNGTPRGTPIGIPAAPDSLPAESALTDYPWQVCATTKITGTGGPVTQTTLSIASASDDGMLNDGQAVLVTSGNQLYLLWRGKRYQIDESKGGRQALGYGPEQPFPVGEAFLNAVPAGPVLTPPAIEGRGGPGPVLAGQPSRSGQLFVVRTPGGDEQYYALDAGGLVPVSKTVAALISGDPATAATAYPGVPVAARPLSAGEVYAHLSARKAFDGTQDYPASPPDPLPLTQGSAACLRIQPGAETVTYQLNAPGGDEVLGQPVVALPGVRPGCPAPDRIGTRPGVGVLARAVPAAGRPAVPALYLVTDAGIKYPLPGASAERLGYRAAKTATMPTNVLQMVPTGPALDPAAVLSGVVPALSTPLAGCTG